MVKESTQLIIQSFFSQIHKNHKIIFSQFSLSSNNFLSLLTNFHHSQKLQQPSTIAKNFTPSLVPQKPSNVSHLRYQTHHATTLKQVTRNLRNNPLSPKRMHHSLRLILCKKTVEINHVDIKP
jgi:hypothetical protein